MKNTIHIKNIDGTVIDVTKRYGKMINALEAETILDKISDSTGVAMDIAGFKSFDLIRQVKNGVTGLDNPNVFPEAKDQVVSAKTIKSFTVMDSIVLRNWDGLLINNKNELIASKIANFNNMFKVMAETKSLTDAITEIGTYKLYTDESDWTKTKAQPAQAATTTAGAITAIEQGKRIVEMDKALFNSKDNAIDVIRNSLVKLQILGTSEDVEKTPFAYTGAGASKLVIVGSPRSIIQLKGDGFVRTLNNGEERKLNAKVAEIDGVGIYESRLLPSGVAFMIMTKRALFSLMTSSDESVVLGEISKPIDIKRGSSQITLGLNDYVIRFQRPFMYGTKFNGEIIAIKYK